MEEPEDIILGDRNIPTWENDVSAMTGPHQFEDEERSKEDDDNVAAGVGGLVSQLKWKFVMVDKEAPPKVRNQHTRRFYDGPEGLRPGVAQSFNDPVECFQ